MAQLPYAFDPSTVEESDGFNFKALPEAWYTCEIVGSDLKVTKKTMPVEQQGRQLVIRFKVVDGPHAGVNFQDNLNIICPTSTKAEDISKGQLKKIARLVGVPGTITDSDVLHGRQLDVSTSIEYWQGQPRTRASSFEAARTRAATPENLAAQAAPAPTAIAQAGPTVAAPPVTTPPVAQAPAAAPAPAPTVTPPTTGGAIQAEAPKAAPTGTVPAWAQPRQ